MDIYVQLQTIEEKQNEVLNLLKNLSNCNIAQDKKVYDFTDLQEMLHVSRRTLQKWKSAGQFSYSQIGDKIYVTEADLNEFLTNNREGGIYEKR